MNGSCFFYSKFETSLADNCSLRGTTPGSPPGSISNYPQLAHFLQRSFLAVRREQAEAPMKPSAFFKVESNLLWSFVCFCQSSPDTRSYPVYLCFRSSPTIPFGHSHLGGSDLVKAQRVSSAHVTYGHLDTSCLRQHNWHAPPCILLSRLLMRGHGSQQTPCYPGCSLLVVTRKAEMFKPEESYSVGACPHGPRHGVCIGTHHHVVKY
jgi:hypothetical protein